MGKIQLNELKEHGMYLSSPNGVSMYPMIRQKKDVVKIVVPDKPPVRYDLVLYMRTEEQGVIHRVLHKKDDVYIINGDNCWQLEYVKPEQIAGIVTEFYRNGKWHSVTEKSYLIYVHLWTDFSFVRRPVMWCRDRIKRVIRKYRR